MSQSATPDPDPVLTPTRFIGCDVGKDSVVVHDGAGGITAEIPNDPHALARFVATLGGDCLIVCEATGGHEATLLDAALAAGIPAHRADARRVKAFIRSLGTLGKTDALDARALTRYGQERHASLALWQPREEARVHLCRLVHLRGELVRDRTACRNRLAAPGAHAIATRLHRILAALDTEIAGLQNDIDQLVRTIEPLARDAATLRSIKGIGATTAAALLALMPEPGTLGRRQIASLAGLAPHPRQSGRTDAYRRTRGGRPDVKRALFMAAMTAARSNPTLRCFYQRLIANGKKPLVALTATMRKLITIANAKIRDQRQTQLS